MEVDKLVEDVHSWEVHQWLATYGVEWDRCIVDRMFERQYDYRFGYEQVAKDGIHHYFMKGNCDVAYYTPIMNSLHINVRPRQWAEESLMRTRELYRFGDHVP